MSPQSGRAFPKQPRQNLKSPRNAPTVFRFVAQASRGQRRMELVAREYLLHRIVICHDRESQQQACGSLLGYVAVVLPRLVVTQIHQIAAPPAAPFLINRPHRVEEHGGVDARKLVPPVPSVHVGDGSLPPVSELVSRAVHGVASAPYAQVERPGVRLVEYVAPLLNYVLTLVRICPDALLTRPSRPALHWLIVRWHFLTGTKVGKEAGRMY